VCQPRLPFPMVTLPQGCPSMHGHASERGTLNRKRCGPTFFFFSFLLFLFFFFFPLFSSFLSPVLSAIARFPSTPHHWYCTRNVVTFFLKQTAPQTSRHCKHLAVKYLRTLITPGQALINPMRSETCYIAKHSNCLMFQKKTAIGHYQNSDIFVLVSLVENLIRIARIKYIGLPIFFARMQGVGLCERQATTRSQIRS